VAGTWHRLDTAHAAERHRHATSNRPCSRRGEMWRARADRNRGIRDTPSLPTPPARPPRLPLTSARERRRAPGAQEGRLAHALAWIKCRPAHVAEHDRHGCLNTPRGAAWWRQMRHTSALAAARHLGQGARSAEHREGCRAASHRPLRGAVHRDARRGYAVARRQAGEDARQAVVAVDGND